MSRVSPHRRFTDPHENQHGEGSERWLLTYSDMITLLLALFVILFAMATVNKSKLEAVSQSIQHSLNSGGIGSSTGNKPVPVTAQPQQTTTTTTVAVPATTPDAALASLETIQKAIAKAMAARGLSQDVNLDLQARGLVVRLLTNKLFYATDSATLTPLGEEVVDTAGGVLRHYDNAVAVEGYTDNNPVTGPPFNSNWLLSSARSVNVVIRLDHVDGVNPEHLSAEGFGSAHPLAPNTSPANMAQNRRVNIVVLASSNVRS